MLMRSSLKLRPRRVPRLTDMATRAEVGALEVSHFVSMLQSAKVAASPANYVTVEQAGHLVVKWGRWERWRHVHT